MRRIYDGYDDDEGDRDGVDDACAECALPCLFLLGPAAVFLVLGIGALHAWRHACTRAWSAPGHAARPGKALRGSWTGGGGRVLLTTHRRLLL